MAGKRGTAKKAAKEPAVIRSIKGFNHDLTCQGFQFEPGKTYEHDGEVRVCKSGFHACAVEAHPLLVFRYYAPGTSRYFEVEQSGPFSTDDDVKICSAKITVGVELSISELTKRAIEWVFARAKPMKKASNSGDYGAASNSGTRGAASNSGTRGAASNSGACGAASNSGTRGAASNSGDCGAASNSGTRGAASNSGDYGAASNSGYYGAASNSGTRGAAFSHAYGSRVMCEGDSQALYITEFANDGSIKSVACGITGRDGVKAGVWYVCKGGKLVEAA